MKTRASILFALLLSCVDLQAQERVAMVRKDGMLIFLPEVGGKGTYGTYLSPSELGREQSDRFIYLGNYLQINFLPPSELPRGFGKMTEKEKLQEFFRTEERYLTKASGQKVEFTDFESARHGGTEYLSATVMLAPVNGKAVPLRLTARTAGNGILHGGYQLANPATRRQAQSMVDRLLRSFRLVDRPLTTDELAAISQTAREQ